MATDIFSSISNRVSAIDAQLKKTSEAKSFSGHMSQINNLLDESLKEINAADHKIVETDINKDYEANDVQDKTIVDNIVGLTKVAHFMRDQLLLPLQNAASKVKEGLRKAKDLRQSYMTALDWTPEVIGRIKFANDMNGTSASDDDRQTLKDYRTVKAINEKFDTGVTQHTLKGKHVEDPMHVLRDDDINDLKRIYGDNRLANNETRRNLHQEISENIPGKGFLYGKAFR